MDERALRRCKARFALDLHPSHCSDAMAGVKEQLNAWLLRFLSAITMQGQAPKKPLMSILSCGTQIQVMTEDYMMSGDCAKSVLQGLALTTALL